MLTSEQFLGKGVPNEPFPRVNGPAGFDGRIEQWFEENNRQAIHNIGIVAAIVVAFFAFFWYGYR